MVALETALHVAGSAVLLREPFPITAHPTIQRSRDRRGDLWHSRDTSRARHGSAAVFRVIMERNNRRLFRVARSLLKDDAEAGGFRQETYSALLPISIVTPGRPPSRPG
jgi:hypothetical protein